METVLSTWRDADGNHHRIEEMSTKYINNCVEQIRRIVPEYARCPESELTADEIKEKAEKYKYEMIERSNQYAEDVLSFLEQKLEETLEEVKNNKRELNPRM